MSRYLSSGSELGTEIEPGADNGVPVSSTKTVDSISATLKGFIKPEEEEIIMGMYLNSDINNIIIQIVDMLGESICSGKNPSRPLLVETCEEVLRKNRKELGNHIWFTESVLKSLPDRKGFAMFFLYEKPQKNAAVDEFRNERSHSKDIKYEDQSKPVLSAPKKVESNYDPLKEADFTLYVKLPNVVTEVPKLSKKDIAFGACVASDCNGFEDLTGKLKQKPFIITHDPRSLMPVYNNNLSNSLFVDENPSGMNVVCLYDEKNDITHIVSGVNSEPVVSLAIKGKVSQEHAGKLMNNLRENGIIQFNPINGSILFIGGEKRNVSDGTEKFVNAVIDYFNNGEYEKE